MVEACLLFPWFVFLFVGAVDAGFDLYALIGVQSAARIAVLYTSSSSSTANASATACSLVLQDLNYMPNIYNQVTSCSALPLEVTATGPTTDQFGNSYSTVSVTYQTVSLIPIPGVLAAQFTITRTAQMQLRS
ncbi:MAG TPA: TadE family protein [Bryobacteraceae bacterium]